MKVRKLKTRIAAFGLAVLMGISTLSSANAFAAEQTGSEQQTEVQASEQAVTSQKDTSVTADDITKAVSDDTFAVETSMEGIHYDAEKEDVTLVSIKDENGGEYHSDKAGTYIATYMVVPKDNGERNFSFARKPGADTQLKKEELDQTLISGCRIFHFGSLSLTDEPAESATIEAVKMAKAAGVLISYDPNYRPSLWKSKEYAVKKMKSVVELVDVMKVSDEESILLTGAKSYEQAAEEILAMGPKLVAITLGEHGVLMATKSRKEIIKAFQTHAVDTTGAGDSFWGGVLCSILSINKPVEKMEWEEIRKCAVLGNAVAGLCVQKRGGIPAIPTKEAVFEFMQK